MSDKQNDIYIENLIQRYREAVSEWDGESEKGEELINDIAGELMDLGINPEDLED